MSKTKDTEKNPIVYSEIMKTLIGDIRIELNVDVFKEKFTTWVEHLKKRRRIGNLSEDRAAQKQMERTYSLDPFVKAYLEQGLNYYDAVEFSIKDYKSMEQSAQTWAMMSLLLEDMFRLSFIGDRKGVVLNPDLEQFELDPKHFTDETNSVREELGDPLIPDFDRKSAIEVRVAYIKTLMEKDKDFAEELPKLTAAAFEKMNERVKAEEVDEDGFQSK